MLEQIKACVLFQHQRHLDPTRISIERAVEMATLDGARAAGLADEIGSLDVGKQADIAIFDMRRPHVGVLQRPLSAFICAGKGSDAKVVMVGGKIVYRDGQFMNGPKPGEVLQEAERLGLDLIKSAGLSDRLVSHWPVQRPTPSPVAPQVHR
jgi:5-methylthioadenosine/S-adenosylhomocysteine deaminase